MKHLIVMQTSQPRFVAWVLGTDISAKGTSAEFAVGRLMREHGHKLGLNFAPTTEIWVWTQKMIDAGRCAKPIEKEEQG